MSGVTVSPGTGAKASSSTSNMHQQHRAVPPKKRRRPALSCIECRRRKIKCDRNMPCNHCTQTKNAVCSYKYNNHPVVPRAPPINLEGIHSSTAQEGETQFLGINSLSQSPPSLANISQSDRGSWVSTSSGNTRDSPSEKNALDGATNNQAKRLDRRMGEMSLGQRIAAVTSESDETMCVMGINFSTFEDVMIQDGDNRNVLRTKVFKDSSSNPMKDTKGTICKTRFFGQSHWMYVLKQLPATCRFKDKDGNPMTDEASKEVREVLEKCKRMARAAKAERPMKWHMNPNFKDYIPPRELADKLVNNYLRTCESIYRILHIPSFKRDYEDYWQDPEGASTTIAVTMLLVMAIGTCFHQEEGNDELRSMAQQWVYSAQSWTAAPFEKSRLHLPGIQIHCLLLLARQTNAVGGDMTWTAAGTLLRTAFSMGFHRDPKNFPKIPVFIAQMRRRIWATVLEMTIQTALATGMPPLVTPDDFDTQPPANIDDDDLSPDMTIVPTAKPIQVFTQTSIQIMLVGSQLTRLQIVQVLNNIRSGPTYDEVLFLDKGVTLACNDASRLIKSYPASQPRPTSLQCILLDVLVRRFLLHIHNPFAVQSRTDPRYYFSRKVCLEAALAIFLHAGDEDLAPGQDPRIVDDYTRLKLVGGGSFKDVVLHAAMIIAMELIVQLEEDITSGLPPSTQTRAAREPMYQVVQDTIALTAERIREGENNAKAHLFLSAASAQIYAMTNGIRPEEVVPQAAKQSALHCLELLRARTKVPPVTPVSDPGTNVSSSGGVESIDGFDYGFNELMPDANMNFEFPESWVFTGWEMN